MLADIATHTTTWPEGIAASIASLAIAWVIVTAIKSDRWR